MKVDAVDDVSEIINLIAAEQVKPTRNIPSLGTDPQGIVAELDDFEPAWTDVVRTIRDSHGRLIGAIIADWSLTAGKAWIHGPWVDEPDDEGWLATASLLLDTTTSLFPAEITTAVLASDTAHHLMAELASRRGWSTGDVNHILFIDQATTNTWAAIDSSLRVREMAATDLDMVRRLHDAEFPSTYYSASQLLERSSRSEQIVIVAEGDGYVAGRVQPDGEGYIDYLAVDDAARRTGIGRALTMAVVARLLPISRTNRVYLTVRDDRVAARTLYESLGFEADSSIASYGSDRSVWPIR